MITEYSDLMTDLLLIRIYTDVVKMIPFLLNKT